MTKLSIDSVANDFKVWRASRIKKNIPDHLWDKAVELSDQHPIGKVVRILRLSGSQMAARRKKRETNSKISVAHPISFVELNMPSAMPCGLPVSNANSCNRLEIRRPDGVALAIEQLSDQTMLQLLNQFIQVVQ